MERTAIIVAGGSGVRMGGEVPKQFLPMGPEGKPVLVHTVERMLEVATRVVVVVAREETERWERIARRWGVWERTEICTGGATRFESVLSALERLGRGDNTLVAVHDAVRPLASRGMIERGFALAADYGAAVPGVTPVDSFRSDGVVVDRDRLMAIQTPQTFRLDLLADAYRAVGADGMRFTDDASVVEAAGAELRFFEGERTNIKITTPTDMLFASLMAGLRHN